MVSGEISTIYKRGGKTRKVHHVILLPGLEAAEALSHRLEAIGNLHSDGRPILELDSRDLLEITLDCCPQAIFIPAHIWTPHFSLFGAFSDFSTLEECYGDLSGHIHALETGLSSNPPMNRRLSMLDRYLLVSNSDAHSPAKLGREANVLEGAPSYPALRRAFGNRRGPARHGRILPGGGQVSSGRPSELPVLLGARRNGGAGRALPPSADGRSPSACSAAWSSWPTAPRPLPCPSPLKASFPCPRCWADCLGAGPASKRVQETYISLIRRLGPEMRILRELDPADIEREAGFAVAEGVRRMRAGQVIRKAGYDGEYGVISLFAPGELEMLSGQTSLLGPAAPAARAKPRARAAAPAPAPLPEAGPDPAPAPNPEQDAAIRTQAACTAVIAGPGTGKTRTLVSRIAWLIEHEGVSPTRITAVTFTRQAAAEMLERLTDRLGKKAVRGLTVGTFHAICLGLVPPRPFISRAQALETVKTLLDEHGARLSPAEALRLLSLYKNGLRKRTPAVSALPAWLPDAYDSRLGELGLRDLDGLMLEALEVDVSGRRGFTCLLVDEFQDINPVQHALIAHWSKAGKSLFVIGDPDQAIYGFRGADADCFARLLSQNPDAQVMRLTRNYRSTPQVLALAARVISKNPGGERALIPTRPDGAKVRAVQAPDPLSEGIWIAREIARMAGGVDMLDAQHMAREAARPFSDIAVLCRTRRQLEQIETCLAHDSIPCVIYGRDAFLEDAAVRGALGFFASLTDPQDAPSLTACLTALWRVPAPLCQRAAAALSQSAGEADRPAFLRRELSDFSPLAPWLDAAEALFPRMAREKPRRLLDALCALAGLKGRAMEHLLSTAVFFSTMGGLLDTLRSGEEADIRRASGAGYQSGAVRLMTLHGAKGLEFPVVFLAGVTKGALPLERETLPADAAEERRLYFVGITRAREELIVSCGGEPSAFFAEIPGEREAVRSRPRPVRMEQLSLF